LRQIIRHADSFFYGFAAIATADSRFSAGDNSLFFITVLSPEELPDTLCHYSLRQRRH
jgi:hypothetical protein